MTEPRHLHPVPEDEDLDVDVDTVVVAVDTEVSAVPSTESVTPRELVPGWCRSWPAFRSAAEAWARHVLFVVAFHVTRTPKYGARLLVRSPAGLIVVLVRAARWVADAGSLPARDALVHSVSTDSRGADALYRASERHRESVRARALLAAFSIVVSLTVTVWASVTLRWWENVLLLAGLIGALGVAGTPPDRAIADRAVSTERAPRLTSELIVTALASLGLGKMNIALRNDDTGRAIAFVSPIARDGHGWRADVDLPPGVTAAEVVERRGALASGLRRPLGCVWPSGDPDAHEGRLVLYVADKPLAGTKQVPWPLERKGTTNVFEPFPIGVDERGRPITIELMFASGLIGAVPRVGKTFLLRLLCLGAVLDRRVEAHIYNLKGGNDLHPLAHVAHAYRTGDDPDDITYALTDLRALRTEMRRRYRVLRELPAAVAPSSTITDELASKRRYRLWPVVLGVDECHVWFEHPEHGKEFAEICSDLVKRGPAVGIMVWYATQRPDAASIPKQISDNAVLRFCLKVTGQPANDMVLGTGMWKAGYQAAQFHRIKDRGIAWFVGETTDPTIVRTAYLDGPTAEAIGQRARANKVAGDWLTGAAAGLDPEPDTDSASVLDHLAAVWPAGQDKVWSETLADRLADHLPGTYHGWTGEQVTAAVKPHGLSSVQIKRAGQNRRGITRTDLTAALADRDHNPYDHGLDDGDHVAPSTEPPPIDDG